jgi:hypothetical protein
MPARLSLSAIALLVACGPTVVEKPMTAQEMPVEFAPSELTGGRSEHSRAYDNARGTDVRRMVTTARSGIAVVDYRSTVGDYVFTDTALRNALSEMLGGGTPSWGDSGVVRHGAGWTEWQAFVLDPGELRCIGLRRELKRHAEADGGTYAVQALVIGFLCRKEPAMSEADATRLAAALRPRT